NYGKLPRLSSSLSVREGAAPMNDFWLSCGHHLLDRDRDGHGLLVTDEFLKVYLARPELTPPEDACEAERALHATMLRDPRRRIASEEIKTITARSEERRVG